MFMTPKPMIRDFGYTKWLKRIEEKPEQFAVQILRNLYISKIENDGKDVCRTIIEIRLITSWGS